MGQIETLLRFLHIAILWPKMNADVYYDCTESFNALLTKKLSVREFATDLEFQSNLLNQSLINAMYNADCKIVGGQCDEKIREITELVHATNDRMKEHLIFSVVFSITLDLSVESSQKLTRPDIVLSLNFELPENTTCAYLENIQDSTWEKLMNPANFVTNFSSVENLDIGISYSESLIGCLKLLPALQQSNIVITNVKFGNTAGVTESLGIFKKRFIFLSGLNAAFIARSVQPGKKEHIINYYPYPKHLGDEHHRQLLIKYWYDFPFIIIPLLNSQPGKKRNNISEQNQEISITPYLYTTSCKGNDRTNWYVPSALQTFSQYFTQAVLTHSEWRFLKSEKLREFHSKLSTSNPNIPLQIIVDYSTCNYNWSAVEKVYNILAEQGSSQPLPNVIAKTLAFAILKRTESYSPNVDVYFARRMSNNTKIGCVFSSIFGSLELSTIQSVVNACQQIDGTVYILRSAIDLRTISFTDHQNYLMYENSVRSRLEAMNSYRSEILKLQPNAEVFLQFLIKATIFNNDRTAACSFEILNVNEYFEAIVNWGKFNQIPLILGRAFNSNENQKIGSWLSFLRPHITTLASRSDTAELHPSFVIRNFPEGINNWTLDPCMNLLEDVHPSDIGATYFRNNYLGLTFDTTNIKVNDDRVSVQEYETMLELILNRFDLVEILVADNWEDVFVAINSLNTKSLIGPTKQILFNHIAPKTENYWKMEDIRPLLETMKLNIKEDLTIIKGSHFWLADDVSANDSQLIEETVFSQNIIAHRMGFVYDSRSCLRLLWSLIVRKPVQLQISKFLDRLDYLVCEHELDGSSIQNEFDTHIYLKRVFNEFKPHLDIYIRVEFDSEVNLTPEAATMEHYLRLLSYFKQFGSFYNISYLLVRAFGEDGWWSIKNESDLALANTYEEKFSVYSGTIEPTSFPPSPANRSVMLLSVIFGLLFFGLAIGSVLCIRYKRKTYLSDEEIQHFLNGRTQSSGVDDVNFRAAAECMKFTADCELSILDINIDSQTVLGFGNFGTVYKGTVKGNPAAIKQPNKSCSKNDFKSVLSEVKVLCYVGLHKNVVCFLGAYVKEINKGILLIATEFCSNGSLESYLRTKKQVVTEQNRENLEGIGDDIIYIYDLHRFSIEIAEGMEYISGKKIVHTDLSTRNVLLDDALTCKIGDFGLSRKLYEDSTYVKKTQEALPWKWMAYESLTKREFTVKSDVWSYGITLWEIYSLGSTPYGELNFETDFVENLRNGLRPPIPQFASDEIYSRMKVCWCLNAEQRPIFTELSDFFKSLCSSQYAILPLMATGSV